MITMETKTGVFRGVRNEDTSAAVRAASAARTRKALERKVQAAEALLIEQGYSLTPPTKTL